MKKWNPFIQQKKELYNIEVLPEWILNGGDNLALCESEMDRALSQSLNNSSLPEVIFTYNDYTAIAVMRSLAKKNISIPGDISIIGMDNIEMSAHLYPSLTTVSTPTEKIVDMLVFRLLESINGKASDSRDIIAGELIQRQSVSNK